MSRTPKRMGLVLISLFCLLLIAYYMYSKHPLHHEKKHVFSVTHPWRQSVEIINEYVGQVVSVQHIELRSFEKGYLQHIYVDEGQFVKQGQKMFQIMPLILKAEVAEAQAEYDISQIEYKNTKRLADKRVVSENELALAKAKLAKTLAKLQLAQTHLQLSTIKAPFDGIMDRFRVRLGSLVEEGELLTTVSDNRKVWVYFNVSEVDYLDFMEKKKTNQALPLKLLLANGQVFPQVGKLDTVEADFNNETGNIAFRASFPNPKGLLRHGQTGNIILSEQLENALVIPQRATFEVLDKQYVYVIDHDGFVRSKKIKVSHELPHLYVIQSGISKRDTILLEGFGQVHPGDKIKTKMLSSESVQKSLDLPVE